jgi:hypothetical protein
MTSSDRLFLHEEILLLALRDDKGTVAAGGTLYTYGIAGALLAELLLADRIAVVTPRKTPLVEPHGEGTLGDPLLDECLEAIRTARKRASLQRWVARFVGIKKLHHRVAHGLCRRGVLRADEDKILGIFSRKLYPERDPGPERRIIERLRRAIFGNTADVDARTVALLSLARHTGLLKLTFDRKELKERKARIERIMNGDLTGGATREAIQAMQTAVFVAAILPAILTPTIMHH